jgi:hypothetical protein
MKEKRNTYSFDGKSSMKEPLGRSTHIREDNMKNDLKEMR